MIECNKLPQLKRLERLQLLLSSLNEEDIYSACDSIKELGYTEDESQLDLLAQNIIFYSGKRLRNHNVFIELTLNLIDNHPIFAECLKHHISFATKFNGISFLKEMVTKRILSEEDVSDVKANGIQFPIMRMDTFKMNVIANAIRNDDAITFNRIISNPSFDVNEKRQEVGEHTLFRLDRDRIEYLIDYAAFYGSLKCFELLLSRNASITHHTMKCAIAGANPDIIKALESRKLETKEEDIDVAIIYCQEDLYDWLIELHKVKNENIFNLCVANRFAHGMLSFQQPMPIDIKLIARSDFFELIEAIPDHDTLKIPLLVHKDKQESPGVTIINHSPYNIIKYFIENNQIVATDDTDEEITQNYLEYVIDSNNYPLASLIIEKIDISDHFGFENKVNPFYRACLNKSNKFIELLMNCSGFNVNENNGKSPLIISMQASCFDAFKIIIKRQDFDINYKIHSENLGYEDFPLLYTCRANNILFTKVLLKKNGIDVNQESHSFDDSIIVKTPLGEACNHGCSEIVSILLKNPEIDPNCTITEGNRYVNPLILSCMKRREEIIYLLLNHKDIDVSQRSCSVDDPSDEGTSPLFEAKKSGSPKIISMIQEHELKTNS